MELFLKGVQINALQVYFEDSHRSCRKLHHLNYCAQSLAGLCTFHEVILHPKKV